MVTVLALLIAFASPPRDTLPPAVQPVRYELDLRVDVVGGRLSGRARTTVVNRSNVPASELSVLLYRLMRVSSIHAADGRRVSTTQGVVEFEDFPALQVRQLLLHLDQPLAPGGRVTFDIEYAGLLRGYAETGMLYVRDRIDTTYTLLRVDAYAFPAFAFPSDRGRRAAGLPEYDYVARVTVPDGFTVANIGRLTSRTSRDGWTTFEYRNLRPAWRMDFGIARFGVMERDGLRVFHLPADSAGATRFLNVMEQTLGLYTRWFGPRDGGASFTVLEIPAGWGSQADVTGILQTASAFQRTDSDTELYHEISHLWNVTSTENPSPRWNEGLATFLEDVTADSLQRRASTDSAAEQLVAGLKRRMARDTSLAATPMLDYGRAGMTDLSYRVGALMFYVLYRVMGHDAFARAVGDFYRGYRESGGSTADFARVAQRTARDVDLAPIFRDWMYTTRWTRIITESNGMPDVLSRYRTGAALRR